MKARGFINTLDSAMSRRRFHPPMIADTGLVPDEFAPGFWVWVAALSGRPPTDREKVAASFAKAGIDPEVWLAEQHTALAANGPHLIVRLFVRHPEVKYPVGISMRVQCPLEYWYARGRGFRQYVQREVVPRLQALPALKGCEVTFKMCRVPRPEKAQKTGPAPQRVRRDRPGGTVGSY